MFSISTLCVPSSLRAAVSARVRCLALPALYSLELRLRGVTIFWCLHSLCQQEQQIGEEVD